jgi:hypothetical protein
MIWEIFYYNFIEKVFYGFIISQILHLPHGFFGFISLSYLEFLNIIVMFVYFFSVLHLSGTFPQLYHKSFIFFLLLILV